MRYLEPVHLARLRGLRWSLRRFASAGLHSGGHRSRAKGRSQEFTEHREYVPGDELKTLDWKVYARKDRFFVREHHEERNLRTYLLMDASGSMAFRGAARRTPKWEYGCHLAAAVSFLALSRSDAAGLLTFSDRTLEFRPPRARMEALADLDRALEATVPQGATRLPEVLRSFAPTLARRSLLVVVSDLLGRPSETVEVLKTLRSRRHELWVLQVLDPAERDLDLEGPVLFKSLEGQPELRCDVLQVRDAYRREFERAQRLYESSFRTSGIAYEAFFTDLPWEDALARFLSRQAV